MLIFILNHCCHFEMGQQKSKAKQNEYSNPGISQTNRKIYGKRMTPKKTASVLALYEVYTNHRCDKQQKSTIFHIPSYKEEFQVK